MFSFQPQLVDLFIEWDQYRCTCGIVSREQQRLAAGTVKPVQAKVATVKGTTPASGEIQVALPLRGLIAGLVGGHPGLTT